MKLKKHFQGTIYSLLVFQYFLVQFKFLFNIIRIMYVYIVKWNKNFKIAEIWNNCPGKIELKLPRLPDWNNQGGYKRHDSHQNH